MEMGSSSVPWNGAVTLLVAPEMLVVAPLCSTMRKMAEPWKPVAHAVVVAQVGLVFVGPLAGFSATVPGAVPMTAETAWAGWVTHRPSNGPPTTTAPASHAIVRRFLLRTGFPSLDLPSLTFILHTTTRRAIGGVRITREPILARTDWY